MNCLQFDALYEKIRTDEHGRRRVLGGPSRPLRSIHWFDFLDSLVDLAAKKHRIHHLRRPRRAECGPQGCLSCRKMAALPVSSLPECRQQSSVGGRSASRSAGSSGSCGTPRRPNLRSTICPPATRTGILNSPISSRTAFRTASMTSRYRRTLRRLMRTLNSIERAI